MSTIKIKHPIAGAVLGLISGIGMLAALAFSSVAILPAIVIAVLGVWAGLPSAIIASCSNLFAAYALGGGLASLVVFEAAVIPAWCVIMLINKREKYYDGIKQSVFMQCGALFVLVLGAWIAIGGDLVEYVAKAARASVDSLPSDYVGAILSYFGQFGIFGSQTGLDFSRALPLDQQTALLDALFSMGSTELKSSLASILLSSGVVTGAVSYAACAGIVSRRGDDPIIDYAHPHDWRLSPSLIIGPASCAAVCYIAYMLGMSGADSAYLAFYALCVLLFMVQGLGAVDRRFKQTGAPNGIRTFVIAILVITGLYELLAIVGVISALVGSKGLITTAIKKRSDKGDGEL